MNLRWLVLKHSLFHTEANPLDVEPTTRENHSMKTRFSIYTLFFLKAVSAASVIMFTCMALGELVYDKNLFSGFLSKPFLWVGVFLETSIATILMTAMGALILSYFRFLSKKAFASISAIVWCLLGILLIALYNYFYWKRDWHLTEIAPGLMFGWILPGVLSIIYFVSLSLDLRQMPRDPAT